MSLVDLIKKEDDEYISVNAFIKLVSNHTKDSNDLVIEYIGKFCLSDRHDSISIYIKNSGNGYSFEGNIKYLISKSDKTDSHRFYTMSELEKNDEFLTSYFLKDEIFNASFIKSLNLNPNSYKKPFINVEDINNPVDKWLAEDNRKYISALQYVNNLGKGIGSGKPLKVVLECLIQNVSFNEVELYLHKDQKYLLVTEADILDYKTSIEVLGNIYHSLDSSQFGINFTDENLKTFIDFHFKYADLPDLSDIDIDTFERGESNQSESQLPTPKLSDNSSVISNLGENQRLLITYAFFTASDMTCLIVDENPAYINNDANYLRHHRMVCNAIDAGFLVPNDTDQIPAEQVKTWLANHNFIYKGFNDKLSNDNDKVGLPAVGHVIKTYDQLVEELATANNRIKQQDIHIKSLEDKLIQQSNIKPTLFYDWKGSSQYDYPPELHLALIIWEKSYILNEIDNPHIKDHSDRFGIIAGKIGLDKTIHGAALISRLSKITNPQINKQKKDVENFKIIKGLNIKDLDDDNPQE
ncbi:hypothetical protein [Psychrobacter sp. BF1]|uniref:hypothetical protein n=1 Tax=Psychrobacter sp. BF1 TaxID=2821147 RepID=UPI001C4E17FA|nr:hypothetical protein [Psychrobacter sp. BF1]